MKNQYFQLVFRDEQIFLHIYPAIEDGKLVNIKELTDYLDLKRIQNYDIKTLGNALKSSEETEVCLGPWDGIEVHEMMTIDVSLDKMKAVCRFYPPSAGGRELDKDTIIDDLGFKRVKFGIDEDEIDKFLKERQYCTDYVLAKGQPPRHGKDAKIEYYFNVNKNLQPKRNEDGSVDYKELNTISHVHKGDLLARLIKEDKGDPGKNIYGEEILPRTVKSEKLSYGKNISINEDGTEIYSEVTGHVNKFDDKVFVSDVFAVPADVDNSIGNIEYQGSVTVAGNVKAGFSVKATGDVIIEGIVENAYIEAGGQIIVKHGIHGMHKGVLKAKSNVIAKYIENATVIAGGYVEAEVILNSDVSANDEVRVFGKKGLINGGTIRAGRSIEAENLGTSMGTITTLEVGIAPEIKERYANLSKEVSKRSKEQENRKVIIDNYGKILKKGEYLPQDKLLYVQKLALAYKEEQAQIEPLRNEMYQIHVEMVASDRAYISVTRAAFPGVCITISDLSYHVKDVAHHCKFKKVDGEIKSITT
ncbi:MAG: FapA family protein [Agathobacter sp.]|nr:FapA family protein [Agathobacter sp.]